jgi:hypothetical protein
MSRLLRKIGRLGTVASSPATYLDVVVTVVSSFLISLRHLPCSNSGLSKVLPALCFAPGQATMEYLFNVVVRF